MLNSPKGQRDPLPPDLVRREVTGPAVHWTWSLVRRRDESRTAVLSVVEALTRDAAGPAMRGTAAWLPATDPYHGGGSWA